MVYTSFKPIAALALATLAISGLSGCAKNKQKTDTAYIARDVSTLYNTARGELGKRNYKKAAELFDEVERQHPYSPWARRATLMSAYSYYLARDYTQSIQASQRFVAVHPGNKDAPYAYYMIAMCYYEQIADVSRDQKMTENALGALGELTRRYPGSRFAADARLKIDLVNDHLAGKEMEIGRFHQKKGQWIAATMRFRNVVDKYQTTTHTPEALERLVESYLRLGVLTEAKKAAAVLGANYPGTKWYAHAHKLIQEYASAA